MQTSSILVFIYQYNNRANNTNITNKHYIESGTNQ